MTVATPAGARTDGLLLRELRWTDVAALATLEARLFPDDAWPAASWWSELAGRPRRDYVVVTDADGGLLGYAGLDHGGEVADVMTVAVVPEAQGRGVGSRLLAELERRARAGGAAYLMLEVRADNGAARALYDRAGFTELRRPAPLLPARRHRRPGPAQDPGWDPRRSRREPYR